MTVTELEFMERILDVVDENSGDNSLRAIYFRMIAEHNSLLKGEKGGFKASLEAIDTPQDSYLEARMIIDKQLYICRLYIRSNPELPLGGLVWEKEPDEAAEMLLRLYTIDRQREISYK
jgi:hypothetical protein